MESVYEADIKEIGELLLNACQSFQKKWVIMLSEKDCEQCFVKLKDSFDAIFEQFRVKTENDFVQFLSDKEEFEAKAKELSDKLQIQIALPLYDPYATPLYDYLEELDTKLKPYRFLDFLNDRQNVLAAKLNEDTISINLDVMTVEQQIEDLKAHYHRLKELAALDLAFAESLQRDFNPPEAEILFLQYEECLESKMIVELKASQQNRLQNRGCILLKEEAERKKLSQKLKKLEMKISILEKDEERMVYGKSLGNMMTVLKFCGKKVIR